MLDEKVYRLREKRKKLEEDRLFEKPGLSKAGNFKSFGGEKMT